jgi:hypothetical protein
MAVGSWTEWSRFVLKELERLNKCCKDLEEKYTKLQDCTKKGLKALEMEQIKINTKLAILVAILTTICNGILFLAIKALWPAIKPYIIAG